MKGNFLILCCLLLSACGSPYLFGPTQYGSSVYLEYDDKTRGGLQGFGEGALLDRSTESILVGWEHFSDSDRLHNNIYRGAVKFNVNLLKEPPLKTITNATLNYTIQSGTNVPSTGFILSCANKFLLATNPWQGIPAVEGGKADTTIPGNLISADLVEAPLGTKVSIDVTPIVKDWVSGKITNHGLVFASKNETKGLFENNDQCWTILGDFTLKVEYTKP